MDVDGDDESSSPFAGQAGFPPSQDADGLAFGPEVMPDGSLRYVNHPPILKAGQVSQVRDPFPAGRSAHDCTCARVINTQCRLHREGPAVRMTPSIQDPLRDPSHACILEPLWYSGQT